MRTPDWYSLQGKLARGENAAAADMRLDDAHDQLPKENALAISDGYGILRMPGNPFDVEKDLGETLERIK